MKLAGVLAKKELRNNRYKICKSCVNYLAGGFCKQCGCILRFKVMIEDSKCPINKW
jgi:hypothetical protein